MSPKQLFLTFVLVTGFFISCCEDTHWNVVDFDLEILDGNGMRLNNEPALTDTIYLNIRYEGDFVSSNFFGSGAAFINSAYAISCPQWGNLGMDDAMIGLEISSNFPFNGIPPGSSLNHLVLVDGVSVDEWLDFIEESFFPSVTRITIPVKPEVPNQRFNIRMKFESGWQLWRQSERIRWI